MHFLKLLHFAALLHIMRLVFPLGSFPAAVLAIASGSLLFVDPTALHPWLILKLSAVALLVVLHSLCGALILRVERRSDVNIRSTSGLVAVLIALLVGATLWLVLGKPAL